MWDQIRKHFIGLPAQLKVARLLFRKGFQVREDSKVVTGGIKIAHTQIATEAGVERRAVDETIRTILENPQLKKIYTNLRQICSLRDAAHEFGLSVIVVTPRNPKEHGIIANVTKIVAEKGFGIRQAFAEDMDIEEKPGLTLIIDGKIPPGLINEIKDLPGIYSVTVY